LSAINDKLGDNLVKVRTLSEDSLMAMAEHPSFGLSPCLNMLFSSANPSPSEGKKDKKNL
jgi:hypothetical protein